MIKLYGGIEGTTKELYAQLNKRGFNTDITVRSKGRLEGKIEKGEVEIGRFDNRSPGFQHFISRILIETPPLSGDRGHIPFFYYEVDINNLDTRVEELGGNAYGMDDTLRKKIADNPNYNIKSSFELLPLYQPTPDVLNGAGVIPAYFKMTGKLKDDYKISIDITGDQGQGGNYIGLIAKIKKRYSTQDLISNVLKLRKIIETIADGIVRGTYLPATDKSVMVFINQKDRANGA